MDVSFPPFSEKVILTVMELQIKIDSGHWKWEDWPSLKTIRISLKGKRYLSLDEFNSAREVLILLRLIDFEKCPSLENIVIFDFECCVQNIGNIKELCLNRHSVPKYFDIEHVTSLELFLELSAPV